MGNRQRGGEGLNEEKYVVVGHSSLEEWLGPTDPNCKNCGGEGWVCERHKQQPFDDNRGCWICKLGKSEGIPCPTCRPHCHSHTPLLGGDVQVLEA